MKGVQSADRGLEVFHASVFFTGRVQGVGFRYKVLQVAREFDLSGFVRNGEDGRVQLEAEGAESEVRAFIAEVRDRLGVFIRKTEETETWRSPQYRGFTIAP